MTAQEPTPPQPAPPRIADIINTLSTHAHWGQHPGELWGQVMAGLKDRLPYDSYKTVCAVLVDTWQSAPGVQEEVVQFDLRLDHNCSAGACADGTCSLCVNSASRPCPRLFKSKYLLRDGIVPACGAGASVSVVKTGGCGATLSTLDLQKLPPILFQVCALPWSYYRDHKDHIPWDTIHECKTITKDSGNPAEVEAILSCKEWGHLERDGFISFPHPLDAAQGIDATSLHGGATVKLPEVFFPKRSAEALLEGKRPQLVLVVRAVHAHTGAPIHAIRPAASPPFHVATRRTRGNEKAYIPSTDQEVRVLEHIGDACISKLKDLREQVRDCPEIELPATVPEGRVVTVDHMLAVVAAVENDKAAESKLFLKRLKLNDDRLAELKEQLKRAVRPDSQLRVFYCGTYPTAPLPGLLDGAVDVGLVFTCTRGTVDLHEAGICGMVMRSHKSSLETIVPRDHLVQEPQLKPLLLRHARRAWCTPGHPGWGFYTFQGRSTERMPPEGAARYTVDPNKIPCFTPAEYADATAPPTAASHGGSDRADGGAVAQRAQELSMHSASTALASGTHRADGGRAAAESVRASVQQQQQQQQHSPPQQQQPPPQQQRQPPQQQQQQPSQQQQPQRQQQQQQPSQQQQPQRQQQQQRVQFFMHSDSYATAQQAGGNGGHAGHAHQPSSPGAALAAAIAQATVTARAAPQEAPAQEHAGPARAALSAPLEPLVISSARSPLGSASVAAAPGLSWMDTHSLAAHAGRARSAEHGPPPALFQPPAQHTTPGGCVRPRSPAMGAGSPSHKRVRHSGARRDAVPTSGANPVPASAAHAGTAAADGSTPFFSSVSGISSELVGAPGNAHLSSMLRAPGALRSAAAASSDLGSFAFGSDSIAGGTPAGSVELAV